MRWLAALGWMVLILFGIAACATDPLPPEPPELQPGYTLDEFYAHAAGVARRNAASACRDGDIREALSWEKMAVAYEQLLKPVDGR